MPDPVETFAPETIILAHPNPAAIIRAYVQSDYSIALATEHEHRVHALTAEGAAVTDPESYARVGERLKEVATYRAEIERWFEPLASMLYKMHRMACDRRTRVLDPLVTFEREAKANRLTLERAEERARREREREESERARREQQERIAREAEYLENRGEPELARVVLEEAVHAPAPVVSLPSALPSTPGVSTRVNWQWQPIGGDTPEGRARALKLVPREFLELSDRKITAYVKANGASAKIPGLEVFNLGSVTVR